MIRYNSTDIVQHLQSRLCYDAAVSAGVWHGDTLRFSCSFRNNTVGDAFTDNDTIAREVVSLCRSLRLPLYMVLDRRSKRNRAGVITTTFILEIPAALTRPENADVAEAAA